MKFRFSVTILLTILAFFSPNILAADILYTYCVMPENNTRFPEKSVILLSYDLSSGEVALYVKQSDQFEWLAGRKAERDAGFGGAENIDELKLALRLRDSVVSHRFVFIDTTLGIDSLEIKDPELCEFLED